MYQLDALFVIIMLLDLYMLGASRITALIKTASVVGTILGLLPLLTGSHASAWVWVIAATTVLLKGLFIPAWLHKAIRDVHIRREVEPLLGYIPSLLLGACGASLAMLFADTLPLAAAHQQSLLVPASFTTILTGFLLLITRHKAITQVVGFLTLENGIFLFGLLLIDAVPFLVELGMLLDLFVAVFVLGIILNRIQRTFSSLDTVRLAMLKETP